MIKVLTGARHYLRYVTFGNPVLNISVDKDGIRETCPWRKEGGRVREGVG
jgi:hypothetical protein